MSLSFTEMNTVPSIGSTWPEPSWLLTNAMAKSLSMPITSPVERISGPRIGSTPGKRANGNTASLTATCLSVGGLRPKAASGLPAITSAAMAAIGLPMTLATNGTVREARGFTSST